MRMFVVINQKSSIINHQSSTMAYPAYPAYPQCVNVSIFDRALLEAFEFTATDLDQSVLQFCKSRGLNDACDFGLSAHEYEVILDVTSMICGDDKASEMALQQMDKRTMAKVCLYSKMARDFNSGAVTLRSFIHGVYMVGYMSWIVTRHSEKMVFPRHRPVVPPTTGNLFEYVMSFSIEDVAIFI
jgi:hypothetical protein